MHTHCHKYFVPHIHPANVYCVPTYVYVHVFPPIQGLKNMNMEIYIYLQFSPIITMFIITIYNIYSDNTTIYIV